MNENEQPVWEERWHPLREEWVIVAAHRQNRPWSGETLDHAGEAIPDYVPDCYLCPGNLRVSGARNMEYERTFVFDNDHPGIGLNAPPVEEKEGLYRRRPATGIARVVCYSPKHNQTLAELEPSNILELLKVWQTQYLDLGRRSEIAHVLIFENKGEAVGVSNPHPHCQIYGTNFVFKTIETEAKASQRHWEEHGRTLLSDVIAEEKKDGRRVLHENEHAIAFLPFFARYAYEVFIAPKAPRASLAELKEIELNDLALAMKNVLVKFDNLWRMPFPYVMVLHQAPTDGGDYRGFHFHIEFHPPLRKPNLLKYLAGPEIGGGNFLSDTSPEQKAAELKNLPEEHYIIRLKHMESGSEER